MISVKETDTSLEFKVLAVPRSSKNQIVGSHEDALKVKLTAPPVEGAANRMCLDFLSRTFQVPKACLEIVAGRSGRHKMLLIRLADDSQGREQRKRIKKMLASY